MTTYLVIALAAAAAGLAAHKALTAPFSDMFERERLLGKPGRKTPGEAGGRNPAERAAAALGRVMPLSPASRERTRARLVEAGLRVEPGTWHGAVLLACASGAVAGAALGTAAGPAAAVPAAAAGAFAGWAATRAALSSAAKSRRRKIVSGLPAAIELLRIVTAAGLPVEHGFREVARSGDLGPVAEEFGMVGREIGLAGVDRAEALANMADRVRMLEMGSFCSAMIQATRQGTPVSKILKGQAEMARKAYFDACRERIAKISVWIAAPLALFFIPSAFLLFVAPLVPEILGFFGSVG